MGEIKETYESPLIEIVEFEAEDIITTSGGRDNWETDIMLYGTSLYGDDI